MKNIFGKQFLKLLLRMVGIVIFLYLITTLDIGNMGSVFMSLKSGFFMAGVFLSVIVYFPRILRYKTFLGFYGIEVPVSKLFRYNLIGRFLSIITPGQLGEISKAFYVKNKETSLLTTTVITIVDRLFDIIVIFISGLISAYFFPDIFNRPLTIVILISSCIGIICALVLKNKLLGLLMKVSMKVRGTRKKDEYLQKAIKPFNFSQILYGILLSVIAYWILVIRFYLFALSLGIDLPFFFSVAAFSIMSFTSYVPISFGGLGTRDAVLLVLFGFFSVTPEYTISLSILIFGVWVIEALTGFFIFQLKPIENQ